MYRVVKRQPGTATMGLESENKPLVVLFPHVSADHQTERPRSTTVAVHADVQVLALRTVPLIVKNGGRKLKVNALLDEASTKTYINADVAAELGLQERSQKVTVNGLNGKTETFETNPVKVELESLDASVKTAINAFTAEQVAGNMKAINWGRKVDSPEGHTISGSRTTPFCGRTRRSRLRLVALFVQKRWRNIERTSGNTYAFGVDMC